jgi:hypothetical protein
MRIKISSPGRDWRVKESDVIPAVKRRYVTEYPPTIDIHSNNLYTFYRLHLEMPERSQEIDGAGGDHMTNMGRFVWITKHVNSNEKSLHTIADSLIAPLYWHP